MFEDLSFERGDRFIGAIDSYEAAQIVILGAPMDYTSSFRPGSRFGPERIRSVSRSLEEYSPNMGKELAEFPFFDAGDLALPFGNVARSLELIREAAGCIVSDGKIPITLGGEHLVTLPAVEAVRAAYPDVAVLHFDAHTDLRGEYTGERLSHATVMRLVAGVLGYGTSSPGAGPGAPRTPQRSSLFQFGIRSGTREEFDLGREMGTLIPGELPGVLVGRLSHLKDRPVYVTIDIDIVDPAFAPGTGAPEPCGISPRELFESLWALAGVHIVGLDLVEVLPAYDYGEITSLLAAKLVREAVIVAGLGLRRGV
ncbi:MAG TPA: agmatinase family protein [Firmicutes bacterium]|nr:agmatinase family protein [Bacillota bacterium]